MQQLSVRIGERWKQYRDTHYIVSNQGRVWSRRRQRFLGDSGIARRSVTISIHKKTCTRAVAVLVWETFCSPIPKGYHIHHKDENPLNDNLDNLECLSIREHRQRHAALNAKARGVAYIPGVRGRKKRTKTPRAEREVRVVRTIKGKLLICELYYDREVPDSYDWIPLVQRDTIGGLHELLWEMEKCLEKPIVEEGNLI